MPIEVKLIKSGKNSTLNANWGPFHHHLWSLFGLPNFYQMSKKYLESEILKVLSTNLNIIKTC